MMHSAHCLNATPLPRQLQLRALSKVLAAIYKVLCNIRRTVAKARFTKGSFTIINIYESVQRVLFLMTPSPKRTLIKC